MKTSHYRFGNHKCHAYMKTVGQGFEVGFYFGSTSCFVGNFIHKSEATQWWTMMNKEITKFTKRYGIGEHASIAWYTKFCSHHLYKCYYAFLDTCFAKYQRSFEKACRQDQKKYKTYKMKRADTHFMMMRKAS